MAATDARALPLKGFAYRVTFPILDADGDLVTGAAALDSEVSKDAGTFADCTNEATEIATSSGMYYLDLTSSEMDADTVAVIVKTSTSGAKTTTLIINPRRPLDVSMIPYTLVGTAQSGGTDKIRLASSGPSATNDYYVGQVVTIISGTGAGQSRLIVDYVGADKDAFVYVAGASSEGLAWVTAPDNTSVYAVSPIPSFLPGSIAVTGQNPIVELTAGALADIAQEISDALTVDTYAEPTSPPAATASLKDKIGWLAIKARNKITQTATTQTIFADDGSTTVATSTVSDSSGTATRGEYS